MPTTKDVLRRLPGWVWHALVVEVAMYRNLLRWVFRRPAVPAGSVPLGYAQAVTPVMSLWIFASAAELPLVHVLIPWDGVRVAALVLGVWGLGWMLGALAGLRIYPHLLTADSLRVRNGALTEVVVPWSAVSSARTVDLDLPSSIWTLQPEETPNGTHLRVGVSGRANVTIDLGRPMRVRPTRNRELTVTRVSFWADDPRAVVRTIQERAAVHADT